MAHNTWDFASWSVLSARRVFAGDLAGAGSLVAEATAIGEATGSSVGNLLGCFSPL
ncbi:hypothetical protein G5C60_42045 [Streptomyces sp. HC44]|uniref:Uncharacterized protein n=1 Tax=Streptomyces scabichelini TaxID=2711217 RepID=A0A6G4VJQ4_9ACTN|nr:hypothetical protein [Streptomyces scabichelini]NGO14003.1 hypothetical protein [Streptomyces scabichelini]